MLREGKLKRYISSRGMVMCLNLFAPRLTKRQIKEIFFLRDNEDIGQFYQGTALQYSINRCTDEERKLIKRYQDKSSTLNGHIARLGKKIKTFGYGYTFAFVFKRIVRRFLIIAGVLPDL